MSRHYGDIAFTEDVIAIQQGNADHDVHGRRAPSAPAAAGDRLTRIERSYLAGRDGFYLASIGSTGWPYVQYRGGPAGFLKVLDDVTLAWADFGGNLQYVSTGNIAGDDRVALIVMDYPHQRRLKLYGHALVRDADDVPDLVEVLAEPAYPGAVERVVTVAVAAYDWNCPRHIVPRFTADELQPRLARVLSEVASLRAENTALRAELAGEGRDEGPTEGGRPSLS